MRLVKRPKRGGGIERVENKDHAQRWGIERVKIVTSGKHHNENGRYVVFAVPKNCGYKDDTTFLLSTKKQRLSVVSHCALQKRSHPPMKFKPFQ
jgi:hypothetical protein